METKQKYPDCLLLFRMGDFYETFFEDAVKISQILNITLTGRGKGETRAPLAGIPYHSMDRYLPKLVSAGYKIAICEQIEDPKLAKGIVKRDVVRIITPGTIIEDSVLAEKSNNYIASIFGDGTHYGIAFIDISTGEFVFTEGLPDEIMQELFRKKTAELILGTTEKKFETFCKNNAIFVNHIDEKKFWINNGIEKINHHFNQYPDQLGFKEKEFALCAAGALIDFLHETQKQSLNFLKKPHFFRLNQNMILDATTIKNLDLLKNARDGTARGTLLSVLDKTCNPMGGRLIKNWITHPLKDVLKIKERLYAVEEFSVDIVNCDDLREKLRGILDIERLVSRINYKLARPADLNNLKHSLLKLKEIQELLAEAKTNGIQKLLQFEDVSELIQLIDDAIAEESIGSEIIRSGQGYSSGGSGRREIGIVKKGYNAELDELYKIKFDTKTMIFELEKKEQEKSGIALKVGYNNVFGYFIEISNKFKDRAPSYFIRKQTLVNGERFITQELKEFEDKLLHADERILQLEADIFNVVLQKTSENTEKLQKISEKLAQLDVLSTFAKVSFQNRYVLPEINDDYKLELKNSRHPVVETIDQNFVPNDCILNNDEFLMIITGPNMAGKSTFMRQIALTILMAQIGCFVPAETAKIGVIDQIFTRVGASDDLSMGQSTFMVEMMETANILKTATDKSFIILDEIGRGTSTFDGVAIAWSVAEYILSKIKSKTLFATHYHVLTKLDEHQHKGIVNYNIAVAEKDDEIIFLRKIKRGGTDKSYGIQVAKLAGLPNEVIESAKKIQVMLETEADLSQRIVVEKTLDKLQFVEQKTLNFDEK